MLNLEKHISELLYRYDCVIVPSLGGFVVNNVIAKINEQTGVFSPPAREIGFNRSLSHNDGLLINYMAKCEGVSYETCQARLMKHIQVLKSQLSNGEELIIDKVGRLKDDSIGNIVFISDRDQSFSIDSFGMGTFHFNTLEQEREQKDKSRRMVRRTLQSKNFKQIAASVALVLGLWMFSPDLGQNSSHSSFSDVLPHFTTRLSYEVEEPMLVGEQVELAHSEEAVVIDVVDVVGEELHESSFYIIGGSFKEQQPAELYLKKLEAKGISSAEILPSENGRFRVSLARFTEKDQAVKALDLFRMKNGFTSAWVLSQE